MADNIMAFSNTLMQLDGLDPSEKSVIVQLLLLKASLQMDR